MRGELYGTYGTHPKAELLRRVGVTKAREFVVGSQISSVKAAKRATVVRQTVTVECEWTRAWRRTRQWSSGGARSPARCPSSTFVVSNGSTEHKGLGRYGDALNPWGDIISMATAW